MYDCDEICSNTELYVFGETDRLTCMYPRCIKREVDACTATTFRRLRFSITTAHWITEGQDASSLTIFEFFCMEIRAARCCASSVRRVGCAL